LRAGVESGSERVLSVFNKKLGLEKVREKVNAIKRSGMTATLFFMINNPGETYAEMRQTLDLAKELNPAMLHVYFCTPYPGSQIYDDLEKKPTDFSSFCHYNKVGYHLSKVGLPKLKRFQKTFYREFFISPKYFTNYVVNRGRFNLFKPDEWLLLFRAARYVFSR